MSKKPSGFHAAREHPLNLIGGDALLAGAHKVDDLEPQVKRQVRGLEDRLLAHSEGLLALIALVKAKAGGFAIELTNTACIGVSTMRASWAS